MNNKLLPATALTAENTERQGFRQIFAQVWHYALEGRWQRYAVTILAILVVSAAVATYVLLSADPASMTSMTDVEGQTTRARALLWLINIDLVLLLILAGIVTRRLVKVWLQRKKTHQHHGALHARLVGMFVLLATAPAVITLIFAVVAFEVGIQNWFGDRIRTAVDESQQVARAYLNEHQQNIRADILAMASDIDRSAFQMVNDPTAFQRFVRQQAMLRNLTEAYVIDANGQALAQGGLGFLVTPELGRDFSSADIELAQSGDVVVIRSDDMRVGGAVDGSTADDRVSALVKLAGFYNRYLLVKRSIEPGVLAHMQRTDRAVQEYGAVQAQQAQVRLTMTLVFALIGAMLLIVAVLVGVSMAESLVRPIGRLVTATERVRQGDLSVRLPTPERRDEVGTLAAAFNRMTNQLQNQRQELIAAHADAEMRQRLTEAVLSNVSAGVMSLDAEGVIQLVNHSAQDLMGLTSQHLVGQPLGRIMPELETLRRAVRRTPQKPIETELTPDIVSVQGDTQALGKKTWIVRMMAQIDTADDDPDYVEVTGYVMTFDDVTPLMAAQRKAAWSDVARRLAHEIKNPLTPIQLSAERLRRKYRPQITQNADAFDLSIQTIVSQVGVIGHMVDEFSAFARMPSPKHHDVPLQPLVNEVMMLFEQAHPKVSFAVEVADELTDACMLRADRAQISQALLNLMTNAVQAMSEMALPVANDSDYRQDWTQHIDVSVFFDEAGWLFLRVEDTGPGFPDKEVLVGKDFTDPYMTTRKKGTGLGLAIVRKIIEDHHGRIELGNRPSQWQQRWHNAHARQLALFHPAQKGARVSLAFPPESVVNLQQVDAEDDQKDSAVA